MRLTNEVDFLAAKTATENALDDFIRLHWYLVEVDSSERSITHRIACSLEKHPFFSDWHVDCEYSRNHNKPKRMMRWEADNVEERLVLPDIIVHRRGIKGPNLLVIEAKKRDGDQAKDREKIQSYISEFDYRFGLLIAISRGSRPSFELEWWLSDSNGPSELTSYRWPIPC